MNHSQTDKPRESGAGGDMGLNLSAVPWPENKDYVEVYVSAVANPGIFWVQIVSSLALQLDELTDTMSRHYSDHREEVRKY